MFRGLRVRMGIHAAEAGTFDKKLNQVTKHFQFSGPAFKLGSELGDCAHGGQVPPRPLARRLTAPVFVSGCALYRTMPSNQESNRIVGFVRTLVRSELGFRVSQTHIHFECVCQSFHFPAKAWLSPRRLRLCPPRSA